jgi:hypothetical protein
MHKLLGKSVVLAAALSLIFFLALSKPAAGNSRAAAIQGQGQQADQNTQDGKKDQNEDINDDRQDGPNDDLQEGLNDERDGDREMDKAEGQDAKQEVADSKHANHDIATHETEAEGKNEGVDNDRIQDEQQDREHDEQQGAASEPPSNL